MLISKSYVRSPAQTERFGDPPDVSMAYNGAVPKNAQGQFVCPAVPAKLKRQAGDPPGLCVSSFSIHQTIYLSELMVYFEVYAQSINKTFLGTLHSNRPFSQLSRIPHEALLTE